MSWLWDERTICWTMSLWIRYILGVFISLFLCKPDYLLLQFCDEGLVFTDSLIAEVPIALPIRPEFASALSYWIYRGDKFHDISIANSAKEYVEQNGSPKCNVELANLDGIEEEDDLTALSPKNMIFPISFFAGFALLAILLHVIDERVHKKTGRHTLGGRQSTLDLFDDSKRRKLNRRLPKEGESNESFVDADPEDIRSVTAGQTDAARHGTDLGESNDAQAVPNYNGGSLEQTSNDAALQELLESGAIDEALNTLSRLKQFKKLR